MAKFQISEFKFSSFISEKQWIHNVEVYVLVIVSCQGTGDRPDSKKKSVASNFIFLDKSRFQVFTEGLAGEWHFDDDDFGEEPPSLLRVISA